MPRTLAVLGLCCAALALAPSPAPASWSAPQTFAAPHLAPPLVVATNGTGESVVAWAARRRLAGSGRFRGAVSVTVRDAKGRLHVRRLWESRRTDATGLAAVIDRRGRITVVWTVRGDERRPNHLRAAYRAANGRWSATGAVGKLAAYTPHLAAAPNGDVLLAFNGSFGRPARQSPAIAWRAPGRPFGAVHRLTTAVASVVSMGSEPHVAFDARGTAYAWDPCAARVLRAAPGRRVFGRPTVLGPRGRAFGLAVRGAGDGLATWVDGGCAGGVEDPGRPGPVRASVLRAGAFAAPVTVSPAREQAALVGAVTLPGGRAALHWSSSDGSTGSTRLFSAHLLAGGAFGAIHDATGEHVAVAADALGDQLLEPVGSAVEDRAFVMRPSGGAADEPATRHMLGETARYAVATPNGRGAAIGWLTTYRPDARQRVGVTVWRP